MRNKTMLKKLFRVGTAGFLGVAALASSLWIVPPQPAHALKVCEGIARIGVEIKNQAGAVIFSENVEAVSGAQNDSFWFDLDVPEGSVLRFNPSGVGIVTYGQQGFISWPYGHHETATTNIKTSDPITSEGGYTHMAVESWCTPRPPGPNGEPGTQGGASVSLHVAIHPTPVGGTSSDTGFLNITSITPAVATSSVVVRGTATGGFRANGALVTGEDCTSNPDWCQTTSEGSQIPTRLDNFRWSHDGGGSGTFSAQMTQQGTARVCLAANCTGTFQPFQYSFEYTVPVSQLANRTYLMTARANSATFNEDVTDTENFVVARNGSLGLSCNVIEQTVDPGVGTSYTLGVSATDYAGPVSISVSGLPAGASSPGATATVGAGTTPVVVPVATSASTPAGTSTLTFTATAQGASPANCTSRLIVRGPQPQPALWLEPTTNSTLVGSNASFVAWYDPDGGDPGNKVDVTANAGTAWMATNQVVAQPVAAGTFRGMAAGMTPVRAEYALLSAPGILNVGNQPTLTISPGSQNVNVGGTAQYTAWYDPDGNGTAAPQDVTNNPGTAWSSGAPVVAQSTGGGRYTGLVPGSAQVNATYSGLPGSAILNVNSLPPSPTLTIVPSSQSVETDQIAQYQVFYDSDGSGPASPQDVTLAGGTSWSSRHPNIATSQGGGSFTGIAQGTATVQANYSNLQATASLLVMGPAGGDPTLTVVPASLTVNIGAAAQYQAWYDEDGAEGPVAPQDVTCEGAWSIVDEVVAKPLGCGAFLADAEGSTGVNVTFAGLPASALLNVNPAPPGAATLTLSPSTQDVEVGDTTSFDAWYDEDGAEGAAAPVEVSEDITTEWSSFDDGVASSLGGGRYRGEMEGSTDVIATYGGLAALANLDVVPGGGPTLRLVPQSQTVSLNGTASFDAFYDPDGPAGQFGYEVNSLAAWDSENSTIASSQGWGVFRGNAVGTTDVSATYSGLTAEGSLEVLNQTPTGACTFGASPTSIFIPPLRSTALTWGCNQPTTCTITSDTDAGTVIGSGGTSGTVSHQPRYSTTYRLSCYGGTVQLTQRVRVFDVTTRVEILPR